MGELQWSFIQKTWIAKSLLERTTKLNAEARVQKHDGVIVLVVRSREEKVVTVIIIRKITKRLRI